MKKLTLKFKNKLWFSLLAVIAFLTGCGNNTGSKKGEIINEEPACEYGCPHADYVVNIKINNENGAAIEGIEIKMDENDSLSEYSITEYTDSAGNAVIGLTDSPMDIRTFYLWVNDIDEGKNGFYQSIDTSVSFKYEEFTGKTEEDNWYAGSAEKTLEIILVKKK
ncbi:MAG: radical SAM-associated putative lipoprotein [Bacteroidales bacterium]|nr:radical SAM-associated putative lipoprotein [Bacteroidales bacterium]